MYRAVVLTTLTLLLIAVTGISLARESTFRPERDSLTEPTVQDTTTTVEPTATILGESTDIADEESSDRSELAVGSVTENSTVPEADDPGVTEEEATGGKGENIGKPKGVSSLQGVGGELVGSGKAKVDEEANAGGGQQKVILCHKAKKTLMVGAPAQDAHLRHGDTRGRCVGQ